MREQEIYIEAVNRRDPAERSRFLDEACGENRALRERVENLIRHAEEVGSFLESSPLEHFPVPTLDMPLTEQTGNQIGPYNLRWRRPWKNEQGALPKNCNCVFAFFLVVNFSSSVVIF